MSSILYDDIVERRYLRAAASPRAVETAVAERRSAQREPQFRMAAFVWSQDPGAALACTVRDISATGARIELDYRGFRPDRSPLELPNELTTFLCPEQIEIDCRLIWQDGRHFGVSFVGEARRSTRRFG